MAYRDVIVGLTAAAERELLALWRRLPERQFVVAGAALIARQNARATTAADLALAAAVAQQLGGPPTPLGLLPAEQHVDQGRLRHALTAVLAAKIVTAKDDGQLRESQAARLARIANDEIPGTASAAMGEAMRQREEVEGWTRNLGPKPCPLCQGWAGETLPAHAPMARHAACVCTQSPVLTRRQD